MAERDDVMRRYAELMAAAKKYRPVKDRETLDESMKKHSDFIKDVKASMAEADDRFKEKTGEAPKAGPMPKELEEIMAALMGEGPGSAMGDILSKMAKDATWSTPPRDIRWKAHTGSIRELEKRLDRILKREEGVKVPTHRWPEWARGVIKDIEGTYKVFCEELYERGEAHTREMASLLHMTIKIVTDHRDEAMKGPKVDLHTLKREEVSGLSEMDDFMDEVADAPMPGAKRRSRSPAAEAELKRRAYGAEGYAGGVHVGGIPKEPSKAPAEPKRRERHAPSFAIREEQARRVQRTIGQFDLNTCILTTKDQCLSVGVNASKACITFRPPFTIEFIEALKQGLVMDHIEWSKVNGVVELNPNALEDFKRIATEHYIGVKMVGEYQKERTDADKLMAKLSEDAKKQCHRVLSKLYHPDVGGSQEMMALVNNVFKGG